MRHILMIAMMLFANVAEAKDWKWNAPINKDGGLTGKSIEVYPVKEHAPYYTIIDGRHVFEVPSIGAKTSNNTKYTRSEMSEMIGGTEARWKLQDGVLALRAYDVKIEQLPCGTKLVIGQIHGKNDERVRLYAEPLEQACEWVAIYYVSDIAYGTGKETKFYLKDANGTSLSIKIGDSFNYIIKPALDATRVSVLYNGVKYYAKDKTNPKWLTNTFYYKWGAYYNTLVKGAVARISFRKVT